MDISKRERDTDEYSRTSYNPSQNLGKERNGPNVSGTKMEL
jgi:hypothetical protein